MCFSTVELKDYAFNERLFERVENCFNFFSSDPLAPLQVGVCGEHGGEPSSVAFFAKIGLDYVSCSPFR